MKLLGNREKGISFIVSAPAGTGKTTLVDKLAMEFTSVIKNISYTTRAPRQGEVDGVDYFFITEEEFEDKIKKGEFLEYINIFGNYYGVSKSWVEKELNSGKHVFLVIDTQGAMNIKGKFPGVYIFLAPPSMEELQSRLLKRQTEDEKVIQERLSIASKEMEAKHYYDYLIINDDLETAYQVLRSIVIAEEHKTGEFYGKKIK